MNSIAWLPDVQLNESCVKLPHDPKRAMVRCVHRVAYCSIMTKSNGSIFHVTGPLCGEFTGHR